MSKVFDPLEIDDLRLRNRFVLPPMQTTEAGDGGSVTSAMLDYYGKRAKQNGLIIVEHSYVSSEGKFSSGQLGIHEDGLIEGLSELADRIKAVGAKAIVQINHAGKRIGRRDVDRKPVAPSGDGDVHELAEDEIGRIIDDFSEAARRAVKAGFDGIEVHGAHGFLLNEFYSPLSNRRTDEFGGSFEKRIKVPLRVVENVSDTIGDKLLFYRLGAVDLDPDGTQIEDSVKFAKMLVDSCVDVVDVSGGLCGSRPDELQGEQGYFVSQASKIKEAVDVPVIGVGGITEPEYADRIVRGGMVDLVAVGRAQKSDPTWVQKARRKLGE